MRFILAALAIGLNALDNLTTYVCLRGDVVGFDVYEANPLAAWGFDVMGLGSGLIFEMVISIGAIAFLVTTPIFPHRIRLGLLAVLVALPAWAVLNNISVMDAIGLQLL